MSKGNGGGKGSGRGSGKDGILIGRVELVIHRVRAEETTHHQRSKEDESAKRE